MRPEHRFSKDLRKTLGEYGCLALAIETGPTNRGVPDLFVAKHGASGWIELKIIAPHQRKEPLTAIQIKRQAEMKTFGVLVLNAHDVRDAQDRNVEYRLLWPHGLQESFVTLYELAEQISSILFVEANRV
jgi:hypothetical protein